MNVGQSVLEGLKDALNCLGIEVPSRCYVGFDRPPQDCCPELVVWVGNIRTYTADFPEERSLKYGWGYAFDVNVRIGRCYVDMDDDGPLEPEIIEDWTRALYQDAVAVYHGFLNQWSAGNIEELADCTAVVGVDHMGQYREGGCAGHEFIIKVNVI